MPYGPFRRSWIEVNFGVALKALRKFYDARHILLVPVLLGSNGVCCCCLCWELGEGGHERNTCCLTSTPCTPPPTESIFRIHPISVSRSPHAHALTRIYISDRYLCTKVRSWIRFDDRTQRKPNIIELYILLITMSWIVHGRTFVRGHLRSFLK